MARSKFLAFACIALALGFAQIMFLSPPLGEAAIERERSAVAVAASAAASRLGERRSQLLSGVVALANTPSGINLARIARGDAPTPAKLTAIRTAVAESLPSTLRSGLVVGWVGESKTLYSRGDSEPTHEPEVAEWVKGMQAPPEGVVLELFGVDHLFYTLPAATGADGKPGVVIWIGAPVWDAGALDSHARELGTPALAVLREGRVVASVGPEAATLAPLASGLPAGDSSIVVRGGARRLAFFNLPLFSGPGAAGGAQAAKVVGARSPLLGSPYEVAAFASAVPAMAALAGFQLGSLGIWFALAVASLVFAYLAHRSDFGPVMRAPVGAPGRPSAPVRTAEVRPAGAPGAAKGGLNVPALADAPPAPEANPDDFQFGASSGPKAAHANGTAGQVHDLSSGDSGYSSPPVAEPSAPPAATLPDDVEEDDSAEATRAVMIPRELLRAASAQQGAPAVAALSDDEQHFNDVFKDFVTTREKCGEPQDGLTFERFAVKLRKSHEQLVQKHQCKTVRFQVYVKDGKAALKATPIRQ